MSICLKYAAYQLREAKLRFGGNKRLRLQTPKGFSARCIVSINACDEGEVFCFVLFCFNDIECTDRTHYCAQLFYKKKINKTLRMPLLRIINRTKELITTRGKDKNDVPVRMGVY